MTQKNQPAKKRDITMSMFLVITAALLGAVVTFAITSSGPKRQIKWQTDLNQAAHLARESGQPVMFFFTIDNCSPCKYMKTRVYTAPAVADLLEAKFIPLKLDMTDPSPEQVQFALALDINAFPTMVFFDSDIREINRIEGAVNTSRLVKRLQQVLKSVDESKVEARDKEKGLGARG